MKISDVRELKLSEVSDSELPFRVEIVGKNAPVYGAGITLAKALMSAFSVSGLFVSRDKGELANFIFLNFVGGENWVRAIKALRK